MTCSVISGEMKPNMCLSSRIFLELFVYFQITSLM